MGRYIITTAFAIAPDRRLSPRTPGLRSETGEEKRMYTRLNRNVVWLAVLAFLTVAGGRA